MDFIHALIMFILALSFTGGTNTYKSSYIKQHRCSPILI